MIGFSALYMPFVLSPIGGLNEAAATTLFAILFLVSLSKATAGVRDMDQLFTEMISLSF